MNLSAGQQQAFDKIMAWHAVEDQVFVLAGYAGTGKSTLASLIADSLGSDRVYYCAYTGKATNVLREKGCRNVNTIHGWLYSPDEHAAAAMEELKLKLDFARIEQNKADIAIIEDEIKRLVEKQKKPLFALNEDSMLKWASLVIVDEYSMLPDKIIDDLKKVSKKILFIGDPYQLPPVEGECSLRPDFFLDEIHRQALDSAIIRFSKTVREGGRIPLGLHGDLDFIDKLDTTPDMWLRADQVIVGKNDTRFGVNEWFRRKLGHSAPYPMAGEKLICLKNNHMAGLFNGMIGQAKTDVSFSGIFCHLDFEHLQDIKTYAGDFLRGSEEYDFRNVVHRALERFTYAYSITAHKSQGSEFDNLMVVNEPIGRGENGRRWLYTAITRAKKKCTLVTREGSK
jgi:exodeoxyribonuclease-5